MRLFLPKPPFSAKMIRKTHIMSKGIFTGALAVLLIVGVVATTAQTPGFVTGLNAELKDNEITLSWDPQPNIDVKEYKVYYSFESIVKNGGLYDESVATGSNEPTFTFPVPPDYETLYLAVMGVDQTGADIDYFVEEISVSLTNGASSFANDFDSFDESFLNDDSVLFDESFLNDDFLEDDSFLFEDDLLAEEDDFFAGTDTDSSEEEFESSILNSEAAQTQEEPVSDLPEDEPETTETEEDDFVVADPLPLEENQEDQILKIGGESFSLPGHDTTPQPQKPQKTVPKQNIPVYTSPPQQIVQAIPTTKEEVPDTLSLLSVEVISPTQVHLQFSVPILVDIEKALEAFSIVDANGESLPITQLSIENENATFVTAEQTSEAVYKFTVSEPAYNPQGLALDPIARSASFKGHASGKSLPKESSELPPAPSVLSEVEGIKNLSIAQSPLGDGYYNLKVTWEVIGDPSQVASYVIGQSRNGGVSFSDPVQLEGNISEIDVPSVTPGSYGIALSLIRTDGKQIYGGFQTINVGGYSATNHQPQFQVQPDYFDPNYYAPPAKIEPGPQTDALSDSGFKEWVVLIMISLGGFLGWTVTRKRLGC